MTANNCTLADQLVCEAKDTLSRSSYGVFTNHVSLGLLIAADIARCGCYWNSSEAEVDVSNFGDADVRTVDSSEVER